MKSIDFPASIFTTLDNAQQNYAQIPYNEFEPNQKINIYIKIKKRREIPLHPKPKYGWRFGDSPETRNQQIVVDIVCTRLFSSYKKFGQHWKNFTASLSKVRLTLGRFSHNPQLLDGTAWKFTIPSFNQIGQEILDGLVENNVCPKKGTSVSELISTKLHARSTTFCKILYRIFLHPRSCQVADTVLRADGYSNKLYI